MDSNDFFFSKIVLSIFGIWPLNQPQVQFYQFINDISLLISPIIGFYYDFVHFQINFKFTLDAFCLSSTDILCEYKAIMLFRHQNRYAALLAMLQKSFNSCFYIVHFSYFVIDQNEEYIDIFKKADNYASTVFPKTHLIFDTLEVILLLMNFQINTILSYLLIWRMQIIVHFLYLLVSMEYL